jgi:L-lactate dehydrogenase complex protein LldG
MRCTITTTGEPHKLEDVDIAIIPAHFGVAENGSIWVTEDMIVERAIPFICENLVVLVDRNNFLPTMHHAYDFIADKDYGFSTFIAGPSKNCRYRAVIGFRRTWTKDDDGFF